MLVGGCRVKCRLCARYFDTCVLEQDKLGGVRVMVWGVITHNFKNGTLTARLYVDEIFVLL